MNILKENYKIIKILNTKTKFNIKKNIEILGLSRQTFYHKFRELKAQKIISNFTININPNIHPNNLKYIMIPIKTNPTEPELVNQLIDIPQLKMLDGIFGEYSLFALFVFQTSVEYYEILNTIDNIMAQSYFKKYHIIEIIKVFKTNGIELEGLDLASTLEIDELDGKILKILENNQADKPISTYEIKEILEKKEKENISQSTVHNRIKRLEKEGIILNHNINFDPKKIGFKGKYLLRIKPKDPSRYNDLALKLVKNPNITDLYRIGEEYGLFAIVRVKKIEDYRDFISNLYITNEIEDTITNFVLDELKSYTNFIIS
ncbi:MAG: Lrp/AsnC family transcriptional regulator [Promethearchaeota archaeon]